MKTICSLRKSIHFVLILSLVFLPIQSHSGPLKDQKREYNEVCSSDSRSEYEKKFGKDAQQAPLFGGACTSADMARVGYANEQIKFAMYTSALVVALVALVLENIAYTSAVGKAICANLDIWVPLAAMGSDVVAMTKNKEVSKNYMGLVSQAPQLYAASQKAVDFFKKDGSAKSAPKKGKTAKNGKNSKKGADQSTDKATEKTADAAEESSDEADSTQDTQAACPKTTFMMSLGTFTSHMSMTAAKTAFNAELKTAKALLPEDGLFLGHMQVTLSKTNQNSHNQQRQASNDQDSPNSKDPASCESLSGNEYTACIEKSVPEVAALLSKPEFKKTIEGLSGKNFGDYLKGFSGKTPEESLKYAASSLGLDAKQPTPFLAKLVDEGKKMIEKSFSGQRKEASAAYSSRSLASIPSSGAAMGEELDFNKLMADLLKKMNPEAVPTEAEIANAGETVFRQMDLLPSEKIEANKDISLFARIGYRYRKNQDNLEKLNWAIDKNYNQNSDQNQSH